MALVGKYFCKKCHSLTFSLRYMTQGKWQKPRGFPQYCSNCNLIEPQKSCISGLNKMKRIGGE